MFLNNDIRLELQSQIQMEYLNKKGITDDEIRYDRISMISCNWFIDILMIKMQLLIQSI